MLKVQSITKITENWNKITNSVISSWIKGIKCHNSNAKIWAIYQIFAIYQDISPAEDPPEPPPCKCHCPAPPPVIFLKNIYICNL